MLLFFLFIAHRLLHKTRGDDWAVQTYYPNHHLFALHSIRCTLSKNQAEQVLWRCAKNKKNVVHCPGSVCSLKRWLPTLLRASVVLLMWVRLIALCNRGRSCQASAEPLASYAEPQPTEDRMRKMRIGQVKLTYLDGRGANDCR